MRRVMLLALLPAAFACRPRTDAREARDFERMRIQQRYDTYGPSSFFANGAVLQRPPANTLSRPAAYAPAVVRPPAFYSGRTDGAQVRDVPMTIDDRLRALGARQFAISCAPCHGAAGFGGGPIAPNLSSRRPPSLRSPTLDTLPAGLVYSIITNGFGQMPPYGWQMPPELRWAVVAYTRTLGAQPTTPDAVADSTRAASLHRLDSLRAAGATLRDILKFTDRK